MMLYCEHCGAILIPEMQNEKDDYGPIVRCVVCGWRVYLWLTNLAPGEEYPHLEHKHHLVGRDYGLMTCLCGKTLHRTAPNAIWCPECKRTVPQPEREAVQKGLLPVSAVTRRVVVKRGPYHD